MANKCVVCSNKIGFWSSYTQIVDGNVCKNCMTNISKVFNYSDPLTPMQLLKFSHMKSSEVLEKLESDNASNIDDVISPDKEFNIDRAINANGLYADFTSKIVMRPIGLKSQKLYYFTDITSYTPTIEGHEVKKHHGIARAATGGILFGGAGAIVGALTGGKQYDVVSKVDITVYLANGSSFEENIISSDTKANSLIARSAKEQLNDWCNLLDRIINENQTQTLQPDTSNKTSSADEIRKYKGLLDDGIISQEEFDKKKSELLNL